MRINTKKGCVALALMAMLTMAAVVRAPATTLGDGLNEQIVIKAKTTPAKPQPLPFPAGGQSPGGQTLSINSRYLLRDGKPWFPVMGEFQFSRYPEAGWDKEILKMKAGGIQVISTYIFWIHHEEIEGQFDWSGQRNLRGFVQLCAKHGMYVWIRIGPWDHGEVRNGGLPDWLIQKTPTRENNAVYLDHVRRFDSEISKQLDGLFWKSGGPIIGVQIENEYSARGPGKGAGHILELRQIARKVGLDAPFYTVTGWDNAAIPSRGILPVFGGYADGFWWRSLEELPPNPNYFFMDIRCEENVGDDLHSKRSDIDAMDAGYPFLTAEMGGGMELSYHRRPSLSVDDTAAMVVVKLGSGVVLYGYYMFHGGTNPEGKTTTLQESQATAYPNDLPVKSYDFQAPLGEFGQMSPSYRALKTFHMFLGDFGSDLAPMTSYLPERKPESKQDTTTPRVAARLEGNHGFLFINNHERTYHLPERRKFQVKIELPGTTLEVPRDPVVVPSDTYTIWPLNLDLGGAVLRYATAQLLCKLDDSQTYVFFSWPGVLADFAFETKGGRSIKSSSGQLSRESGLTYVDKIEPGTRVAIQVDAGKGRSVNIVVLSKDQALNTWKASLAGRERLLLSEARLYFDRNHVHVSADDVSQLQVGIFPALDRVPAGFGLSGDNGVFTVYSTHVEQIASAVGVEKTQGMGVDPPLKMGKQVVLVPEEAAFDAAASWDLHVSPTGPIAPSSVFLQIDYQGDIARLYSGGKLITDNFYNGSPWIVGLDRVPRQAWDQLQLKILPLQNHAPIYLPAGTRPAPSPDGQVANLNAVRVVREYEVVMDVAP